MGSSLVLSSEIVHDGVIRRSERTRGAEFGSFESDGTVIVSGMSWAVARDIAGHWRLRRVAKDFRANGY